MQSPILARCGVMGAAPGPCSSVPRAEGSLPVPLTITCAQRDAIYEIVIPHMTGIGDVWLCVKRREFAEAKKTGRELRRRASAILVPESRLSAVLPAGRKSR
jgi:hypothetical protein